jgi:hypothetical protein
MAVIFSIRAPQSHAAATASLHNTGTERNKHQAVQQAL